MSNISKLKENKDNSANLLDLLNVLFPEMKPKYYELIVRLLKNEDSSCRSYSNLSVFQYIALLGLVDFFSDIRKNKIINKNRSIVKDISKFADYNEKNLIKENDLSKYKSFDDISNQVSITEEKEKLKKAETEVIKLLDDDDWVVVIPLTYESSVKYGYGTKWCTAMETNKSYFNRYSESGILIYCINKKDKNQKIAMYKVIKDGNELSFWNIKDEKIDSMESNLPDKVLKILIEENKKSDKKTISEIVKKRFFNENVIKSDPSDIFDPSSDDYHAWNELLNYNSYYDKCTYNFDAYFDTYNKAMEIMKKTRQ